jgi:hypothetical protein
VKKTLSIVMFALALAVPVFSTAGCAQLSSIGTSISGAVAPATPEAQIKTGAEALTAATTVATVLLRNDKITVVQAMNYRRMLGAASNVLDDANAALVKCRGSTGSTSASSPDPCKPGTVDMIALALDTITDVKKKLDAK